MTSTPSRSLADERGSLLIEVLVSAVLVAVIGVALFGALNSAAKVSGKSKTRAGAAAVAQDDQERMRAMPVATLNNFRDHRDPVVMGKTAYVVDSRAEWIADSKGATDCTANGAAADYLKITSTVSAKNIPLKPVVVTSTVTPAPGTFTSDEGSLAVSIVGADGLGRSGVNVSINGPASDVQLTGKVASFGRGGAINDVATRLFGQFADCLRATLEAETAAAPGLAAAEAGTGAGATPGSDPAAAAVAEAGAPASAVPESPEAPVASPSAAGASPPAAGASLSAAGASPPVAGASPSGAENVPPSEAGAAGDGSTTASDGGARAPAAPPAATVTPGPAPVSPAPPPRAAEALDAGSLVGTVIKGRLAALFQAIAGFFRRLFGGRRSTG